MSEEKIVEQSIELNSETIQEELAGEVKACVLKGEGCKELARKFHEEAKRLGLGVNDLFDQVFNLDSKT